MINLSCLLRYVMLSLCLMVQVCTISAFSMPSFAAVTQRVKAIFASSEEEKTEERVVRIAIFALHGTIVNETEWIKKIHAIKEDNAIHGVIIKIDSGGGAAGASQHLFYAIKNLRAHKPVIVVVGNTCCSGAYMAAVGADCIICPDMSTIGSIGVLTTVHKRVVKNFKEDGLSGEGTMEIVASSRNKTVTNEFGPALSNIEREALQKDIDHRYELFYKLVARERNLNPEEHLIWADAQVFSGDQALALGLVDKIGSYTDAQDEVLALIKGRSGLEGKSELVEC